MAEYGKLFKKSYKNIYNYLYENGNTSFEESPFNDVDAVILSCIAYIPFEECIPYNERFRPSRLKDMLITYLSHVNVDRIGKSYPDFGIKHIFLAMALLNSTRFQKSLVMGMKHVDNYSSNIQLHALSLMLPNHQMAILFRGTDNTIMGWKEDFNMAFLEYVPGQGLALEFLQQQLNKHKKIPYYVIGHSKGGNYALYTAIYAPKVAKDRLIKVYSVEGLGVYQNVYESEERKEILDKIVHLIPQEAVIGRLLHHEKPTYVVKAHPEGGLFAQHDVYNWEVKGKSFVKGHLTPSSDFVSGFMNDWIDKKLSDSTTVRALLDAIFEIVEQNQYETADQMFDHGKDIFVQLLSHPWPKEQKKAITSALFSLIDNARRHYIPYRKEKNKYLQKKKQNEQ